MVNLLFLVLLKNTKAPIPPKATPVWSQISAIERNLLTKLYLCAINPNITGAEKTKAKRAYYDALRFYAKKIKYQKKLALQNKNQHLKQSIQQYKYAQVRMH